MAQSPAERKRAQRANAKALRSGGSVIAGMGEKSNRAAAISMGVDLSRGSAFKKRPALSAAPDRANDKRRVPSFSSVFTRTRPQPPKHGKNVATHAGESSDSKKTAYVGSRRSGVTKVGSISAGAHRAA